MHPSPFPPREVWAAPPLASSELPRVAPPSRVRSSATNRIKNKAMRDRALAERLCILNSPWQSAQAAHAASYVEAYGMHIAVRRASPTLQADSLNFASSLLGIRNFAKTCIHAGASAPAPFKQDRSGFLPTHCGASLLRTMQALDEWAELFRQWPELRSDQYVNLALERFSKMRIQEEYRNRRIVWGDEGRVHSSTAKLLTSYVEDLHDRGNRVEIGRKLAIRSNGVAARAAKMQAHLAKTYVMRSNLAIKRFDLLDGRFDLRAGERWLQLEHTVQEFVRRIRKTYGAAVIFDFTKIDLLPICGHAMHVLIAFAGPTSAELDAIDWALEELWSELTGGCGTLINCGAVAELVYRGTDLTDPRRGSPLEQIERAAWYLEGTDELFEVRSGTRRVGL